jgi:excisionase family DNA binding protein
MTGPNAKGGAFAVSSATPPAPSPPEEAASPPAKVSSDSLPRRSADSPPAVLTADELAALLRVERKTVYAAIRRGEIPGVRRVGSCLRVSRDAVMRWLAEGAGMHPSRNSR